MVNQPHPRRMYHQSVSRVSGQPESMETVKKLVLIRMMLVWDAAESRNFVGPVGEKCASP